MGEIHGASSWTIHENVMNSVDLILGKEFNISQIRRKRKDKKFFIRYKKLYGDRLMKDDRSLINKEVSLIHRKEFKIHRPKSFRLITLKQKTLLFIHILY